MSHSHAATNDQGYVVPHHFDSAEQAYDSAKFGVWLFLVTEILLFGGLFVAYILFRAMYPEMYHEASQVLDTKLGAINTVVLICSSLTMAMAVYRSKERNNPLTIYFLAITLLCAAIFMVVKYFEYSHKFHAGLLPGGLFTNHDLHHPKAHLFFSLYFMMTGLHGFHVLVGMFLISWVMVKCLKGKMGPAYNTPVEMVGIYWHLVDLIWIYLFPLLYLIG